MTRRLFIGGPWNGQVHEIPDESTWVVATPSNRVVVYRREVFGFGNGEGLCVMVTGAAPRPVAVMTAVVRAAGLEVLR